MTAAIRPAAEASNAARARACLPNRFERTPHPTAIAAPILATIAHRSATLPAPVRCELEARAPSTSNPPDTAMNMPMIRNRNGAGSDRPAPRMHNTSRGAAISPSPDDGRRGTDRDRGLVERVHLRLELRVRVSLERPAHPVLSRRSGGGPSDARRPEAAGGSSHSVLFGRPYTESSPSPPHRSSESIAVGDVMNHDSK